MILPLPGIPPTGEALLEMLQHTHADWAAMAPLTLETISKNSALLDGIAGHLKMLLFAGGSLPDVFGDEISSKIRLLSHLGSSESGPLPTMYRHGYDFARDWNYLQLHPAVGAKFDPQPDGAFELVFKKTPETEPHQTVFTMYPDLTEYRTKDLFTPHPSLPDVWTHASRSDDVIVFLNGEKTSPTIFESHVSKHPEISVALMFGSQRFEAGLLIELCDQRPLSAPERAEAIQRLWPTIDSANRVLPTYAQVSEAHICFTDPGAPVLRTLKGSIRRHATIDQYAVKINKLYADVAEMWAPYSSRVDLGAVESIRGIVQKSLQEVTKIGGIGDGDDFFREGMDSLQVLRHVRQLRAKTGLRSIHPGTIYLHPSVRNLASALYALANRSQTSELQREEQQKDATQKTLEKYLDEIESLPKTELEHQVESDNQEGEVVLLTGSTGSIGSYIMRGLMNRSDVTHIYCLNRSSNSVSVQKERNAALDPTLPSIFPKGKVTFLTASLSERTFGLQPSAYAKLCNDVTLVIHSAWPVDFNLPLQSFEAHLEGIVSMASFCAQSKRHAAMLFVSTVSAAMNYAAVKPETRVPEAIINNFLAPPAVGYSQSKHVGEIMVAHAAHQLNLRNATILRLGQIAGAAYSPGRWKQTDWIPTMVRSSQYLGVLPDSVSGRTADRDVIDWLPIDTVSDTVIEIGLQSARESGNVRVFNILSPQRTSWQALLPAVVSAMEAAGKKIKVVSPSDWIAKLRASAATSMDPNESDESGEKLLAANPALRLIGFFSERFGTDTGSGSGLEWDTNSAEEASERLRNAEKIDGTMMERWVKQWCAG